MTRSEAKLGWTRWSAIITLLALTLSALCGVTGQNRGQGVRINVEDGGSIDLYGGSYALVTGVSEYKKWRKLEGVKDDLPAVAGALSQHGFQVETVLNPTKTEFDQEVSRFIREHGNQKDNRLVIYFAGHGHTLKTTDGRELGYIVPSDAPSPEVDGVPAFKEKAISMEYFDLQARQIESKHVLFVFDSCFSGSLFEASRSTVPTAIGRKTADPVRLFITSGTAQQQVPDKSIFKTQFVAGLKEEADRNRDGFITGSELGEFLEDTVTNYSRGSQTPRWGKIRDPILDKGDFVFRVPGRYQAILEERFDNNDNHWAVFSKDTESRAEVNKGYYILGSKIDEHNISTVPVTLNQNSDFQIQCTMKKLSGVDNYFYGLIWGYKDSDNFFNLDITGDGRIAVTKKENGKFFDYLAHPTNSQYVIQGNATNVLRIKKERNQFEFFINDHLVHKMPHERFFGQSIGFIIYNSMQVAFDDLIVTTK